MATLTNPQTIPPGGHPPWKKFLARSKWKLRDTLHRTTKPKPPPTPPQLGIREAIRFTCHVWATLTNEEHATYPDLSSQTYLQAQMDRWTANHGPTRTYPGSNDQAEIEIDQQTATPNHHATTLTYTTDTAKELQAIIIYRSTQPQTTPTRHTAIRFIPTNTNAAAVWVDSPLPRGTYYYRAAALDTAGRIGPFTSDLSVTIP
jgi:hypothetical protein